MINTVCLFTESFPSGNGEQFLETEIKYLAEKFQTIYIIPRKILGKSRPIPNNCKIIKQFSIQRKNDFFEKLVDNDFAAYIYDNE